MCNGLLLPLDFRSWSCRGFENIQWNSNGEVLGLILPCCLSVCFVYFLILSCFDGDGYWFLWVVKLVGLRDVGIIFWIVAITQFVFLQFRFVGCKSSGATWRGHYILNCSSYSICISTVMIWRDWIWGNLLFPHSFTHISFYYIKIIKLFID